MLGVLEGLVGLAGLGVVLLTGCARSVRAGTLPDRSSSGTTAGGAETTPGLSGKPVAASSSS